MDNIKQKVLKTCHEIFQANLLFTNYFIQSVQVEANIHAGVYDLYLQNTIVLGTKASA